MSDVNSEITKDVYLVVPAFNEEKTVSQIIEGIEMMVLEIKPLIWLLNQKGNILIRYL